MLYDTNIISVISRVNGTREKQSCFVAFGNLVVGRACAEEEGDSRSRSCSLEQKVANGDGETVSLSPTTTTTKRIII